MLRFILWINEMLYFPSQFNFPLLRALLEFLELCKLYLIQCTLYARLPMYLIYVGNKSNKGHLLILRLIPWALVHLEVQKYLMVRKIQYYYLNVIWYNIVCNRLCFD